MLDVRTKQNEGFYCNGQSYAKRTLDGAVEHWVHFSYLLVDTFI